METNAPNPTLTNTSSNDDTRAATKQTKCFFDCESLYQMQKSFWDIKEQVQPFCTYQRVRKRARFLEKVRKAKQRYTNAYNLDAAWRNVRRCVRRVVDGHSQSRRRKLRTEYYMINNFLESPWQSWNKSHVRAMDHRGFCFNTKLRICRRCRTFLLEHMSSAPSQLQYQSQCLQTEHISLLSRRDQPKVTAFNELS